jgi:CDP-glucose 4,6-dehydratase
MEGMGMSYSPTRLPDPAFWRGKRVLLTGHSGFKGGWMALWLARLGARITGVSLPPEDGHALFSLGRVETHIDSRFLDIRDAERLNQVFAETRPEIVLHLAAQAYVRRSIADPVGTFETNVQGTVNLLEAIRKSGTASACLCVTSDKVYRNSETGRAFVETDPLGGKDPYSASKAACEIAVQSWRSTFGGDGTALATARGGNVIGGGDFGENRLVPDCVRAFESGVPLVLRSPSATRPWQHVLDCLNGYLLFAEMLGTEDRANDMLAALNIGPESGVSIPVGEVAEVVMAALGRSGRENPGVVVEQDADSIEAKMLALDTARARNALGWADQLPGVAGLKAAADWYAAWFAGQDMAGFMDAEIARFEDHASSRHEAAS